MATLQHMKSANLSWLASAACSVALLSGLLGASPDAFAQWKWRDASGVVQYSDRPPPPGTPEQSILSRPSNARKAPPPAAAASAPTETAEQKQAADLDARKRKAEEDEKARLEAQKKAEEERVAKVRAENCERARSYMRSLNDGIRIAKVNANGEREVLDDSARAAPVNPGASVWRQIDIALNAQRMIVHPSGNRPKRIVIKRIHTVISPKSILHRVGIQTFPDRCRAIRH